MKRAEKKLREALTSASVIVGYTPIGDEPSFDDYVKIIDGALPVYRTSPDKSAPPEHAVQEISILAGSGEAIIFLPGRAFDEHGTRHGRGGGWYDRFLSQVPKKWVRIGVSQPENVSELTLERKPWDEPVDFLLIKKQEEWEVIETPRSLTST